MEYIQSLRDHFCYEPLTGKVFWTKKPSNRVALFSEAGSENADGYAVTCLNRKQMLMHRVIFEILLGRELKTNENVDHINGNKGDNRLENLRLGTSSDNARGFRAKSKGKTSEFRGVQLLTRRGMVRWKAAIQFDGKIHSKHCKTEVEAAHAYDRMAASFGWPKECMNFAENNIKKGWVK